MFGQIIIAVTSIAIVALATIINHRTGTPPTPTDLPQATATATPSNPPVFAPIPTPTQKPSFQDEDNNTGIENTLNIWYYPGSIIAENRSGFLLMTTGDNASQVTNWYKEKVSDMDLLATSVITTTANEKTLNVISASGAGSNIKIEVASEGEGSQITVEY